jgi:hypothetical protein
MRIAIGSDERTHLTDLLIAELRARPRSGSSWPAGGRRPGGGLAAGEREGG